MVIKGKADAASLVAGMPFPTFDRPAQLQPEFLPPYIRYKFAPDHEVVKAARLAVARLIDQPDLNGAPLFAARIWIQPGAWQSLRTAGFNPTATKKLNMTVAAKSGPIHLEGAQLDGDPAVKSLETSLRELIRQSGGGQVRAFKTVEMARWWPFTTFDITEPTLVLETADGQHRFILIYEKGRIAALDDLAGLPSLTGSTQ